MARVIYRDESYQTFYVDVNAQQSEVTIGRNPGNMIRIPTKSLSRYHAKIIYQNGRYFLIDLKSSNGSFVNEQRVTQQEIHPGDKVRFGDVSVEFTDETLGSGSSQPRSSAAAPPAASAQPPSQKPAPKVQMPQMQGIGNVTMNSSTTDLRNVNFRPIASNGAYRPTMPNQPAFDDSMVQAAQLAGGSQMHPNGAAGGFDPSAAPVSFNPNAMGMRPMISPMGGSPSLVSSPNIMADPSAAPVSFNPNTMGMRPGMPAAPVSQAPAGAPSLGGTPVSAGSPSLVSSPNIMADPSAAPVSFNPNTMGMRPGMPAAPVSQAPAGAPSLGGTPVSAGSPSLVSSPNIMADPSAAPVSFNPNTMGMRPGMPAAPVSQAPAGAPSLGGTPVSAGSPSLVSSPNIMADPSAAPVSFNPNTMGMRSGMPAAPVSQAPAGAPSLGGAPVSAGSPSLVSSPNIMADPSAAPVSFNPNTMGMRPGMPAAPVSQAPAGAPALGSTPVSAGSPSLVSSPNIMADPSAAPVSFNPNTMGMRSGMPAAPVSQAPGGAPSLGGTPVSVPRSSASQPSMPAAVSQPGMMPGSSASQPSMPAAVSQPGMMPGSSASQPSVPEVDAAIGQSANISMGLSAYHEMMMPNAPESNAPKPELKSVADVSISPESQNSASEIDAENAKQAIGRHEQAGVPVHSVSAHESARTDAFGRGSRIGGHETMGAVGTSSMHSRRLDRSGAFPMRGGRADVSSSASGMYSPGMGRTNAARSVGGRRNSGYFSSYETNSRDRITASADNLSAYSRSADESSENHSANSLSRDSSAPSSQIISAESVALIADPYAPMLEANADASNAESEIQADFNTGCGNPDYESVISEVPDLPDLPDDSADNEEEGSTAANDGINDDNIPVQEIPALDKDSQECRNSNAFETENKGYSDECDKINSENEKLAAEIDALKAENLELRSAAEEAETLKNTVSSLQNDLEAANAAAQRASETEAAMASVIAERDQANEKIQALQNDMDACKSASECSLQERDKEISDLKAEIDRLHMVEDDFEANIEALRQNHEEEMASVQEDANQRIMELENSFADVNKKYTELRQECHEMREKSDTISKTAAEISVFKPKWTKRFASMLEYSETIIQALEQIPDLPPSYLESVRSMADVLKFCQNECKE